MTRYDGYEEEVLEASTLLSGRGDRILYQPPADWRDKLLYLAYAVDLPVTLMARQCGVTLAYVRKYLRENDDPLLSMALDDARLGNFTSRVDHPRSRDIKAPGVTLAGLKILQDNANRQTSAASDFSQAVLETIKERRALEAKIQELDAREASLKEQNRAVSQVSPGILGLNSSVEVDERE